MDVFDPRFNIVSPACDSEVYFPYTESRRRLASLQPSLLKSLMFGENDNDVNGRGAISDDRKRLPFLFTMARLDSVKNLVGLARWFARSERLRNCCNLFIVGGDVEKGRRRKKKDGNEEEEEEEEVVLARELHELFDSQQLPPGTARWVSAQSNAVSNGELYRVVADTRGAFVQPALFENFGLT